jgi:hypothetical protein
MANKQIKVKIDVLQHYKLKDKFECTIDYDGIIWIKQGNEEYFDRPCMRYCYTEIQMRDPKIADFILNKSCEIQDNEAITERAKLYKKEITNDK